MEDWRQTLDSGEDNDPGRRLWGEGRDLPLGSFHDPSEHWKPPEVSNTNTREHSFSMAYDDPDLLIRATQEYATTTLLEKETCAEHVIRVWDEVSKFIVEKLKEGYGVKIAGLGTFVYCENKFGRPGGASTKVPLMILSEFIVRMYKLITPLDESLCTIPIRPLNVRAVSEKTRIPRRIIDGIITEVLQNFARAIVLNKDVEFPFPSIGKLQISRRKVIFKFYADFCVQLGFENEEMVHGETSEANPFILPGTMTPLRRHIPTTDFRSVFHLREVRSVRPCDLLAPVKEINGKYVATTGLKPGVHVVIEDRRAEGGSDGGKLKAFQRQELFGPKLHQRYTVSCPREKRNYLTLNSDPQPWPRHSFHVVDSSVVLKSSAGASKSTERFASNP